MATGPGLFTVVCNHLKPTMLLRVARPGAFEGLRVLGLMLSVV